MKKNTHLTLFQAFLCSSIRQTLFLLMPFTLFAATSKPIQTKNLLSVIDANYQWSYLSDQQRIEGISNQGATVQIPLPEALKTVSKIYFSRPYLLVIAQQATGPWWNPLATTEQAGWDLWVYSFTQARWHRVKNAFPPSTLDWIHLTCIDQQCLCDALIQDPEKALERQWVRYWVDWPSKEIRSSTIRKGKIDQVLVIPHPTTGIFRYAYLLESGHYLIRYDLIRSHEKEVNLPFQVRSMRLEKSTSSTKENPLIIQLDSDQGLKSFQLDLSPVKS